MYLPTLAPKRSLIKQVLNDNKKILKDHVKKPLRMQQTWMSAMIP